MGPMLIYFTKDVEEERFDIKIEGLVVKKKLGKKTEVLAVHFVVFAVYFPNRQSPLTAVFTDPQLGLFAVFFGVRAEIPRVNLIATNLDAVNVLHLGDRLICGNMRYYSTMNSIHLKPLTQHNIFYYYLPLNGAINYTALSVNIMNPSLFSSGVGSILFTFGSVLLWAVVRSWLPKSVPLCATFGLGSGIFLLKVGRDYLDLVDSRCTEVA
uniref:Uncharacterized protein n=2 Tax=Timema TaxID=61471 RepID=A0A7R9FMF8_9NEOP|nr:unnamed protein product [Timema bartmani]CAD7456320.1 unnamed protein product [Timema tahoe]